MSFEFFEYPEETDDETAAIPYEAEEYETDEGKLLIADLVCWPTLVSPFLDRFNGGEAIPPTCRPSGRATQTGCEIVVEC